jgi:hypothetical protein
MLSKEAKEEFIKNFNKLLQERGSFSVRGISSLLTLCLAPITNDTKDFAGKYIRSNCHLYKVVGRWHKQDGRFREYFIQ